MALKNFALAFQISAAFSGNKAFTDALAKTQELSNTMLDCSKQMKIVDAAYNKGIIGIAGKINAQNQIGKKYSDAMKERARYEKLALVQNKFENSYGNMTKYGANAFQFAEMTKGILSISDVAAEFETKISKVQAITGGTTEDMKLLEKTALSLGKKTKFSASESAEAMSYLGMAGWKTNQIVGAMPGLLNLAAASGEELATVADIISDDLTAFGMKAEDASHMADVFAAVSSNANTNVGMMGHTFKYAASVAGSLGYSLEDVAIATGLMANAGIKGEQAGTSMRAIMTRLVKPPKQAREALEGLGVSVTDKNGKMKTFMQTMEELRDKFSNMTEAERAQNAASIAGQEAMSGFLSVINASESDFKKLSSAVSNCNGKSQEMADTMNDNARGKVIAFKSAMESLQIAVGKNLLPILGNAAQEATNMINAFGNFSEQYPSLISGTLGLSLSFFALGAAGNGLMWLFSGLKTVFYGATAALEFYNTVVKSSAIVTKLVTAAQWLFNASLWGCPILIIGAACVAVGYIIYKEWDKISALGATMWEGVKSGWQSFMDLIKPGIDWISEKWNKLSDLLNKPIFPQVSATKATPTASNATGGIYNRGAFLTTFAENSGESAIPHTPNAHNIGLLAKTNEIMGNPLGAGNTINATFSPSIVVNSNGSANVEEAVKSALADAQRNFEDMLRQYQNQQRRVSFA